MHKKQKHYQSVSWHCFNTTYLVVRRGSKTFSLYLINCKSDAYVLISKTGHPIGHLRMNFGLSDLKISYLKTNRSKVILRQSVKNGHCIPLETEIVGMVKSQISD